MIVKIWRWLIEEPQELQASPAELALESEVLYLREELRKANAKLRRLVGVQEGSRPAQPHTSQDPISLRGRKSADQRRAELERLSLQRSKAPAVPDYIQERKEYWKREIEVAEDKVLDELSALEEKQDAPNIQ
jgi:hypothetical protein